MALLTPFGCLVTDQILDLEHLQLLEAATVSKSHCILQAGFDFLSACSALWCVVVLILNAVLQPEARL